jgi:alpha-N-arabinofuranosidase
MDAVCRYVQARRRSRKRVFLCFDEWNVWYRDTKGDGGGRKAPHLIEEVYDLQDALVVAGFLNSFLRHADCLKIANLAQIVNVIAPLLTDGDRMLVQSTFYPLEMYARRRDGVSMRIQQEGPTITGKTNGTAPLIDAGAVRNESGLSVFLVNRGPKPAPVVVDPADFRVEGLTDAEVLAGSDPHAANSWERPDTVRAAAFDGWALRAGRASAKLPPFSVTAATFRTG